MNRPVIALFAVLEALLVVGIGVGIPLLLTSALWSFHYGLQLDWLGFGVAAVDSWLLGHGVDLWFTADPVLLAGLGFEAADVSFPVTIAPLGFAAVTLLLALRAGRRIHETGHPTVGIVAASATFAGFATVLTLFASQEAASPVLWQGIVFPTAIFSAGLFAGSLRERRHADRMLHGGPDASGSARPRWRQILGESLRGAGIAVAALIAVSSVLVAVLIVTNYAGLVTLYEAAHAGELGGAVLTVAQGYLLPNVVIWAAAWLVGPGFAIGTGSWVGPLGTSLGPLPALPILGALPTGSLGFGFLGLIVPVLCGFIAGIAIRTGDARRPGGGYLPDRLAAAAGAAALGGVSIGVLAAVSGGAAGPGRLVDVGPNGLLVGVVAFGLFVVPALLAQWGKELGEMKPLRL